MRTGGCAAPGARFAKATECAGGGGRAGPVGAMYARWRDLPGLPKGFSNPDLGGADLTPRHLAKGVGCSVEAVRVGEPGDGGEIPVGVRGRFRWKCSLFFGLCPISRANYLGG